jgi:hypothetical protein
MVVAQVERLGQAAAGCAGVPVWPLSDDDLLTVLDGLHAVVQQVSAAAAHVLREIEGRGLPGKRDAALGTAGWLRQRWRISTGTAHRLVELSRALDRLPQLDAALSTAG